MSNPLLRFHVLVDWLEGRLDEERARDVAQAVATADAETQETVGWIEEFLAARTTMPLRTPPPELTAQLHDIFDRLHAPTLAGDWIDAELRHDSWAMGTAGVRSGTTEEIGHLIYHSDVAELLLEVIRTEQHRVDLRGLVQAPSTASVLAGATIAAMSYGELVRAARSGPDGRFELTDVSDDVDELWLTHGETRVRLRTDLAERS